MGGKCPTCGRRLTRGVVSRVEELADRPSNFKPENAIPFKHTIPLAEIVAYTSGLKGEDKLYSKEVWNEYLRIVGALGSEFTVLLDSPYEQVDAVAGTSVAEAIKMVRRGGVRIKPGFDGVYGELRLFDEDSTNTVERRSWTGLDDYMG